MPKRNFFQRRSEWMDWLDDFATLRVGTSRDKTLGYLFEISMANMVSAQMSDRHDHGTQQCWWSIIGCPSSSSSSPSLSRPHSGPVPENPCWPHQGRQHQPTAQCRPPHPTGWPHRQRQPVTSKPSDPKPHRMAIWNLMEEWILNGFELYGLIGRAMNSK